MNEKERILALIDFLNYHTKLYNEGKPEISDWEWDKAYFELQSAENETGIILPNSPTQKIEYNIVSELKKVKHNHLMLSADKTKDWNKFISYFGDKDVVGMLKLDGLTLSLKYSNGKLLSAETRGDGEIGEDVLHNAMVIPSIPKIIDYKNDLIIDGEIICTYKDFEPFKKDYKNPRNFASGSIRLLNPNECKERHLTFIAWNVVKGLENNLIDNFYMLKKLGFKVTPFTSSFDWDAKDFLIDKAKELGYPIDGLVGRFTDREYGNSLGQTEHHTKAIYAFKMYDEEYETELLDIEWSMSRTGQLTPVAIYKTIEIDGSECSRASLHNLSVLNEILGVHPYRNQKIKIFKANAIIPQVSWADKDNVDYDNLIKQTCCPVCGGKLEIKDNDGVITLWCANPDCEGKILNILDHFCSRKGLDIKGLSKMTLNKLIELGWIKNRIDIFNLEKYKGCWEGLPGFGVLSVNKILNAIEESKHTTLEKFICSLGIPLIGTSAAKEICKCCSTWEDFKEANKHNWSDLEGFGPEMEKALWNYDYTEADEIAKILTIEEEHAGAGYTQNLAGKTFVITGKLTSGTRDEVKERIEKAGGKVASAVSSKTNYLVANAEENTTKYNKAKELNIPIINENILISMLN